MIFNQSEFEIRCEWGGNGVFQLAPISDAVIIVDVMSFSTCVTVAVARGAIVYPYRFEDKNARVFADFIGAELAGPRGESSYSLSPASLLDIPEGTRLVLPSPNGSTLTLSTGKTPTLAGCFRNCRAVAHAAMSLGRCISVVPAGERWVNDNSLRPAYEDLAGAGAIINHLKGSRSPEAEAAVAVYRHSAGNLLSLLKKSVSGQELIEMEFEADLPIIAELDVDDCAPILSDRAYSNMDPDLWSESFSAD